MDVHDLAHWLEDQPQRELLVAPHLLAGPHDHGVIAAQFTSEATAPGWIWECDDYGGTYAASPSRQLVIAHRPNHDVYLTWSVTWSETPLGDHVWMVAMTDTVPDEIAAAVTTALRALPEADARVPGRSAPTPPLNTETGGAETAEANAGNADRWTDGFPPAVLDALDAAGWKPGLIPSGHHRASKAQHADGWEFASPFCHGWVTRSADEGPGFAPRNGRYAWELTGGPHRLRLGNPDGSGWQVILTAQTPTAILKAAVDAMCDTAPVRRQAADVLGLHPHLVRALPADWATPDTSPRPHHTDRARGLDPPALPTTDTPAAARSGAKAAASTTPQRTVPAAANPAAVAAPTKRTTGRR